MIELYRAVVFILEAVHVSNLAIANYLLFESLLSVTEALEFPVRLQSTLEVLELHIEIALNLHRVVLHKEVLIWSKQLLGCHFLTFCPSSQNLQLL